MAVPLKTIVDYCDAELRIGQIKDFPGAFNGLQFECDEPISQIAAMVDIGLPSIEKAIAGGANFILAHHGLFWKGNRAIVGTTFNKYRKLMEAGCALYSAHLPLDAHDRLGNNVLLAKALNLEIVGRCFDYEGTAVGVIVKSPENRNKLVQLLKSLFPSTFQAMQYGSEKPERIAICSGSGASCVDLLKNYNIDTFITGELRQAHFSQAQDEGLNLYTCGHYATEVFGVQSLADELSKKFDLPWFFVEEPCLI
jgi:dinuclear metal center YbgI/SA1388 family protein